MQQELASIGEVVWLSAPDALDRADSLLSGLGYYTTHRGDYHLTAQRPASLPKKGSMKGPAMPARPAPRQVEKTAQVEKTSPVEAILDRQDQLEKIRAGLLPGEEIEAVLDVKGGGTGFMGITSKRVIFQDNAWVVKSMTVVSIPYSRMHTVAAEDSASLLTGSGFFSSSRVIITTSGGSRVFQFRGAEKAHIAHNLILRHIL